MKIGVRAFGEALTIIPRTLCATTGRDDAAYVLIELQEAHKLARKNGTGPICPHGARTCMKSPLMPFLLIASGMIQVMVHAPVVSTLLESICVG